MRLIIPGAVMASLVLSSASCVKWAPITEPIPVAVTHLRADMPNLRLTLIDGQELVLAHPWIRGDSLIGEQVLDETRREPTPLPEAGRDHPKPAAIALSAIRRVERMQRDRGLSILAIAGAAGGLAAIAAMVPKPSSPRAAQGGGPVCSFSGCARP